MQGSAFRPTLDALFADLKTNPKQFPLKKGKLKAHRAAELQFNNTAVWRCVFFVDDAAAVVHVRALAPHDKAYAKAARR